MKYIRTPFISFLLGNRVYFFIFIAISTIIASFGIRNLYLEVTIPTSDLKDSSEIILNDQYEQEFGSSNNIILFLETDNILSTAKLNLLHQILADIKAEVPLVTYDYSIFSLFPKNQSYPLSDADVTWLVSRLDESRLKDLVVSADKRGILSVINLEDYSNLIGSKSNEQPFLTIGRAVDDIRERYSGTELKILATGSPYMQYREVKVLQEDLFRVVTGMAIVALLFMFITFRFWIGIIGTIINSLLTVALMFGIFGWFGINIPIDSILIPTLLGSTISIGYTIHFLNHYHRSVRRLEDSRIAIRVAWRRAFQPLLYTTLTTVLSLLSLLQTGLRSLQITGLACIFVVSCIFFLTITLLPCLLSYSKRQRSEHKNSFENSNVLNTGLMHMTSFILKKRIIIFISFLLITVFFSYYATKINISLNLFDQFGSRVDFVKEGRYLQNTGLIGFDSMPMLVKFKDSQVLEPSNLAFIVELQNLIETKFGEQVLRVRSVADIIADFQHIKDPNASPIPESIQQVNGLVKLLGRVSNLEVERMFSADGQVAQLAIDFSDVSSNDLVALTDFVRGWVFENKPGTQISFSGFAYNVSIYNQVITARLLRALILSSLVIIFVLFFLFRKLSFAAIAIVPNIMPIIITGGIIGLLDIKLDNTVMMIGPMIIGLTVDDTVHFFHYALERYRKTGKLVLSIEIAMHHVGIALIQTSVILTASFLTFIVSKVQVLVMLGVIAAVGIMVALLSNLIIAPILLYWSPHMFRSKN